MERPTSKLPTVFDSIGGVLSGMFSSAPTPQKLMTTEIQTLISLLGESAPHQNDIEAGCNRILNSKDPSAKYRVADLAFAFPQYSSVICQALDSFLKKDLGTHANIYALAENIKMLADQPNCGAAAYFYSNMLLLGQGVSGETKTSKEYIEKAKSDGCEAPNTSTSISTSSPGFGSPTYSSNSANTISFSQTSARQNALNSSKSSQDVQRTQFKAMETEANKGNPEQQFNIAKAYFFAKAGDQYPALSTQGITIGTDFLMKSVTQGHPDATLFLAEMYCKGYLRSLPEGVTYVKNFSAPNIRIAPSIESPQEPVLENLHKAEQFKSAEAKVILQKWRDTFGANADASNICSVWLQHRIDTSSALPTPMTVTNDKPTPLERVGPQSTIQPTQTAVTVGVESKSIKAPKEKDPEHELAIAISDFQQAYQNKEEGALLQLIDAHQKYIKLMIYRNDKDAAASHAIEILNLLLEGTNQTPNQTQKALDSILETIAYIPLTLSSNLNLSTSSFDSGTVSGKQSKEKFSTRRNSSSGKEKQKVNKQGDTLGLPTLPPPSIPSSLPPSLPRLNPTTPQNLLFLPPTILPQTFFMNESTPISDRLDKEKLNTDGGSILIPTPVNDASIPSTNPIDIPTDETTNPLNTNVTLINNLSSLLESGKLVAPFSPLQQQAERGTTGSSPSSPNSSVLSSTPSNLLDSFDWDFSEQKSNKDSDSTPIPEPVKDALPSNNIQTDTPSNTTSQLNSTVTLSKPIDSFENLYNSEIFESFNQTQQQDVQGTGSGPSSPSSPLLDTPKRKPKPLTPSPLPSPILKRVDKADGQIKEEDKIEGK